MNVLLIVSAPTSPIDSNQGELREAEVIHEAVRELAAGINASDGTLIVADHPNIVAITSRLLPPSRLRIIQRGAEPVLAGVSVAVLIGGGEEEIALAKRVRNARIRVIPVASTGLAPVNFLVEMETNDEIDAADAIVLLTDTDYPALFKRLLSS